MNDLTALILGLTMFVATNIDDIFILLGFFADPKFRVRDVVVGQYLGIGALVLASGVAALVALVIPPAYVGLLGLIPIAIGIKQLFTVDDSEDIEHRSAGGGFARMLSVAAVTIANGGDNIGVYTPVFAVRPHIETVVIVVVFAVMTGLWCALGYWMVNHSIIGAPIRRYAHRVLPFVLIGIGAVILYDAAAR